MDNNQNVNMNNQPVNPVNPTNSVNPTNAASQTPAPTDNAQSNVVTLGTVSNVTYADTIGEIDYSDVKTNDATPPTSQNNNNDGFMNANYNETSISDLNVEGAYNNMNVRPDYTNDPKVMEIIHPDPEKKNTVKIGKELKTFFLIAALLLVFIMVLPYLFDLLNTLRFRR